MADISLYLTNVNVTVGQNMDMVEKVRFVLWFECEPEIQDMTSSGPNAKYHRLQTSYAREIRLCPSSSPSVFNGNVTFYSMDTVIWKTIWSQGSSVTTEMNSLCPRLQWTTVLTATIQHYASLIVHDFVYCLDLHSFWSYECVYILTTLFKTYSGFGTGAFSRPVLCV